MVLGRQRSLTVLVFTKSNRTEILTSTVHQTVLTVSMRETVLVCAYDKFSVCFFKKTIKALLKTRGAERCVVYGEKSLEESEMSVS